MSKFVAGLVVCALLVGSVVAAPILDIPDLVVDANAATPIPVYIEGGDELAGLNLHLSISEGTGAHFAGAGHDFLSGTIFQPNHSHPGSFQVDSDLKGLNGAITTESGVVTADGLLVTIYIDTTNMSPGESFELQSWADDEVPIPPYTVHLPTEIVTEFAQPISVPDTSGTITYIPEPGSFLLLSSAFLLMRRRMGN